MGETEAQHENHEVENIERPTVWRNLRNLKSRFRYIGKRIPVLRWLALIFYPLWWLVSTAGQFIQSGWQATRPNRVRQRRRWRSRISVQRAKFRTWITRRQPPANAHIAKAARTNGAEQEPQVSKGFSRTVTLTALGSVAVLTLAVVYLFTFRPTITIISQGTPLPNQAEIALVPSETPTPTITPTPTNTPTPTPVIIELSPWPTPDPLAGGGSVVFELNKNGNSDLYGLAIGQEKPIRLTDHVAEDSDPAWSPDGRKVAFTSRRSGNYDLFVLDMQSGEIDQITNQTDYDGNPSWSPDGQWLVYESHQGNNLDIYIVRVDLSQGPIRLTENEGPDYAPMWSPDGRHIAWSGMRQGNSDIWLMSLDSVGDSQAINLTQSGSIDESNPSFGPFGNRIAWSSRDKGNNSEQVIMANLSADNQSIDAPVPIGAGQYPDWSPAGDALVWSQNNGEAGVLLIGTVNSFGVVPNSFLLDGAPRNPDWSGVSLAAEPAGWLTEIEASPELVLFTESIGEQTVEAVEDEAEEDAEETQGIAADVVAAQESVAPPISLRRVLPADTNDLPFLSDNVDQSYLALRSRIQAETGIDLLADIERMFVPLNAASRPGESDEIWHKAGRAFDLNSELALGFSPLLEVVRRDSNDQTYWEVFIRVQNQDGTQGKPMTDIPWDFRARFGDNPADYDKGGRLKDGVPAGYYVSLTALAEDYGWEPVPADRNWRTFYPGVRFWQFEKREGLTWQQAMLEIYDAEELE